MALTDPQVVTINLVDKTLNRIKSDGFKSIYALPDGTEKLTVSHQETKNRTRRMARLDSRVVAADPLTSENEYKDLGVYIVVDQPNYGFSDTEIDYRVQALCSHLDAAFVAKLLGDQH